MRGDSPQMYQDKYKNHGVEPWSEIGYIFPCCMMTFTFNITLLTVDFLVTENMVDEFVQELNNHVPQVKTIVDDIISRNMERIYFVACGSPLNSAQTAKFLFERYSDIQCMAYSGWEFCDNTPHKLDNRCAVIGISDYGRTEEVIQALEMARERGALTVSVPKRKENPIAAVDDYVIAYEAECIWEVHLLICYTFAPELIERLQPHPEAMKIINDIPKLPKVLGDLVNNWEEKGRQLGEQAQNWKMIYTVASGPLRPLAYKEGIVTMMEFTWTHGSIIESGEFRHGPLEVVEDGVPFVFLLGTDESRHTTERAINFVKRHDQDVIVIDYADISQGLHPMLAPFVLFVPMEWFSYYLAIYKDHNPDDRRYYGGLVEY